MQYKAMLVDVDGTLVPFGEKAPNTAVVESLQGLQRRGIPVAIATGRSFLHLTPQMLGGFVPDYAICYNGTYVADRDGNRIYSHAMNQEQLQKIMVLGEAGHQMGFSFDDGYYVYYGYEEYIKFYGSNIGNTGCFRESTDNTRHLESMPYVGWGRLPQDVAQRFGEEHDDVDVVPIGLGTYDLCQAGHNKATGAQHLLDRLGLSMQEVVAIGDGGNDREMLRAAGMGIAMGNASSEVKACADHVTDSVESDGVVAAVRRFF